MWLLRWKPSIGTNVDEIRPQLLDDGLGDLGLPRAWSPGDAEHMPLTGHRQRPRALDEIGQTPGDLSRGADRAGAKVAAARRIGSRAGTGVGCGSSQATFASSLRAAVSKLPTAFATAGRGQTNGRGHRT